MAHPSDNQDAPRFSAGGEERDRDGRDRERRDFVPGSHGDPVIGRVIGSNFRVLKLIGTGAMGHVYQAEQLSLGKMVALKLLRHELMGDERLIKRFELEARNASRLNHANSIQIIDFGRDRDLLYIAMELLPGVDLGQLILREGPLPLGRVARITEQVLAALDEAHAQGIVHRDLKPGNIMLVSRRGDPDFVKVCDFGIAKAQTSGEGVGLTMKGLVCGTPEYMSPEQARGEEVDGRSDLYAVGVILYQLVTGDLPFTASSPVGILSKHLAETPVRPSLRRPAVGLPAAFEGVILRALAKEPEDRPQGAEQMRRELRAAAAELPDYHPGTYPRLGAAPSSPDLASQPTTPIRVSRPRPEPGSFSGVTPGSSSGSRERLPAAVAVPSTLHAPETRSVHWPRRLAGLTLGLSLAGAAGAWWWMASPLRSGAPPAPVALEAAASAVAPAAQEPETTAPAAAGPAPVPSDDEAAPAVGVPPARVPPATAPPAPAIPEEAARNARPPRRAKREVTSATGARAAEAPTGAVAPPAAAAGAAPPSPSPPTSATEPIKEAERLLAQGEVANACPKGEEQKSMTPRLPAVYKFLGKCYMRAGQPERARENYRRYLELAPDAADAAFIRSIVK